MEPSLENLLYSPAMAGRPSYKEPTETGARLAALRKAAGLSQIQFAKMLGIPQRTISFYEREAQYIPSNLLAPMAEILGVSIEEIVGTNGNNHKKRGPKSKLERQFEAVKKLTKNDQKFISKFLDQMMAGKK